MKRLPLFLQRIATLLFPTLVARRDRNADLYAEGTRDGRAHSGGTLSVWRTPTKHGHRLSLKRADKHYVEGFHAGLTEGFQRRGLQVDIRRDRAGGLYLAAL